MAAQTITVSYDRTNGFTFQENGAVLPNGDVTVDTAGSNSLTFNRNAGEAWTFDSFSVGLGVQATNGNGSDTVQVGVVNNIGSSFSWTVADANVAVINQDRVPANTTYTYKYSFVIDVPGVGTVPCDPKIYNRIG